MKYNFFLILSLLFLEFYGIGTTFGSSGYSWDDDTLSVKKKLDDVADTVLSGEIDDENRREQKKREILESEVRYRAKDTIKINVKTNTIYLYDEAEVEYGNIKLNAGKIEIDNKDRIIKAHGIQDTAGNMTQLPEFQEDGKKYYTSEMDYNMDTEQALIKKVKTTEQEGYVGGQRVKKIDDNIFYAEDFYFSTDEKLTSWIEYPDKVDVDYYIKSNRVKMISGEKIIASESVFYIAEVPTPLFIPSAFFPISSVRSSGIIIPTYADSRDQGFGLTGGGYYFVINEHFDFKVIFDIYTKGSWALKNTVNYKKRYGYSGRFYYSYENVIRGERGFDDYSKSVLYNINWSHSQDSKANPSLNFSASVNLASGEYYQNSLDHVTSSNFLTATTNSSINLSKTFEDTPFSMSMSASHTQNFQTGEVSMNLPNLNISMNRIYPFSKDGQKKMWYQKIGISLNTSLRNSISTYDSLMFTPQMFDDMKTIITHSIPMSTSFNVFKYFSLSPSISYTENWFLETIKKEYDKDNDTVYEKKVRGFDSYREFSTGVSLATTIYGMFDFGDSKIKAIRHLLKPSISYSFRPDFSDDFWGYYENFYTDPNLGTIEKYTRFKNISSPSSGLSSSISFSVSNTFEAKVKNQESEDEKDKYKKISLIDQLSFSTSYNMAASEFKWSNFSGSMGLRLIKDRVRINMRSTYDFYGVDGEGQRINKYYWETNKKLLRHISSSGNVNFSISNKDFISDKKSDDQSDPSGMRSSGNTDGDGDGYDSQGYLISQITWNMSFGYSLVYTTDNYGKSKFTSNIVSVSGDVTPTKNWKMGFSTGYDINMKKVSFTSLNFSRDLNTFYFTFNWVPLGTSKNYNFFIGIKANILKDLKYEKKEYNLEKRL